MDLEDYRLLCGYYADQVERGAPLNEDERKWITGTLRNQARGLPAYGTSGRGPKVNTETLMKEVVDAMNVHADKPEQASDRARWDKAVNMVAAKHDMTEKTVRNASRTSAREANEWGTVSLILTMLHIKKNQAK